MSEEKRAVEPLAPEELEQVPEHLDDAPTDAPTDATDATDAAAVKPGGPLRFARMTGSSIAGRDAAAWITDFLNATYYRRPVAERDVDDLRLAFSVLTTFWYRNEPGRRMRVTDLGAFHRAYGGHRLRLARVGELTPESAPPERQTWHMVTPADAAALRAYFGALDDGLARYGKDEPRAMPEGAEPVVGFDLTTHQGHFMGSGHNRVILYTHDGQAWVRAVGTWDPMPWHVEQAYRRAGHAAQHAFWGQGNVERLSMIHQLAKQIA